MHGKVNCVGTYSIYSRFFQSSYERGLWQQKYLLVSHILCVQHMNENPEGLTIFSQIHHVTDMKTIKFSYQACRFHFRLKRKLFYYRFYYFNKIFLKFQVLKHSVGTYKQDYSRALKLETRLRVQGLRQRMTIPVTEAIKN